MIVRVSLIGACLTGLALAGPVEFAREVKPLFNEHCVGCHGGVKQASQLSLINRAKGLAPAKSGKIPIVPGEPDKSELIARVSSADPEERMPPPEHGRGLSQAEIATLREWVRQGAPWEEHWSFVLPTEPAAPKLHDASWPRQSLDAFVLAPLEREGLRPAPEEEARQWLRRATFDLTGLPPSLEQVREFEGEVAKAGASPERAYEGAVDRLLSSPRYGERWAAVWLDLARYADSRGYEADQLRVIWPYRDWLVRAFNADLPYDQFAIKQLAGDLLPGATLDDHVASAFHRNTPTNDEGGTDDEEFRVAAVVDRITTTWRAFQGVTFHCAQCHSHPYEPIEHAEYYRFMAYFNTQKDWDVSGEDPLLRVPLKESEFALARGLDERLQALRAAQVGETTRRSESEKWRPLEPSFAQSSGQTRLVTKKAADGVTDVLAEGTVSHYSVFAIDAPAPEGLTKLTAMKLDALPIDPAKAKHSAELGFVISLLRAFVVTPANEATVLAATTPEPDRDQDVSLNDASKKKVNSPPKPEPPKNPPALPGEITFALALGDEVTPFTDAASVLKDDASGWGANPRMTHPRRLVLIPSRPVPLPAGAKLRLLLRHDFGGFGYAPLVLNRARFSVTDNDEWTRWTSDPSFQARQSEIAKLASERGAIPGESMPVMAEQDPHLRRETRIFLRGNWLDKGEAVTAAPPALCGPPSDVADRLALARWMVSERNPLASRVAVNRFWEQLFGIGIVETLEDFGSSGQAPSNQALLDHLARRFQRDLGWSMKRLLREMVVSATYRQSAKARPELSARDPRNRLLARGPRARLTSEMVRDNALSVAGLLSTKMAGPSVMPEQPDGIWRAARSGLKWTNAKGEDAHRRSLYTFWRRSSPYPSSLTFDAPERLLCSARRIGTNTPLQALVTLNDPVFVECAASLASRVRHGSGDLKERISQAFELATGQAPSTDDLRDLVTLHDNALSEYASDATLLKPSDSPEHAALTVVANAILNLDAAISK